MIEYLITDGALMVGWVLVLYVGALLYSLKFD